MNEDDNNTNNTDNQSSYAQNRIVEKLDFIEKIPPEYLQKKFLYIAVFITLFIGIMLGAWLFGGSSAPIQSGGLKGVVSNSEIPKGRARCGMVDYGKGCVLYIVNSQRREVLAKELYSMAANMTKVPEYIIESSNLRYSNTLIRPGYIAQINIQPIK